MLPTSAGDWMGRELGGNWAGTGFTVVYVHVCGVCVHGVKVHVALQM